VGVPGAIELAYTERTLLRIRGEKGGGVALRRNQGGNHFPWRELANARGRSSDGPNGY